MVYNRVLSKSVSLYTFSGYEEDYSFLNGTIYISNSINYFGDTKVVYTGENLTLKDFEMGFYIKEGVTYKTISTTKMNEDAGKSAKLKDILYKTDFSFTEVHKESQFLSKDNMNSIDKLVFRIKGIDNKDKEVDIEIPMIVESISK